MKTLIFISSSKGTSNHSFYPKNTLSQIKGGGSEVGSRGLGVEGWESRAGSRGPGVKGQESRVRSRRTGVGGWELGGQEALVRARVEFRLT
jgi:hypothetical protein